MAHEGCKNPIIQVVECYSTLVGSDQPKVPRTGLQNCLNHGHDRLKLSEITLASLCISISSFEHKTTLSLENIPVNQSTSIEGGIHSTHTWWQANFNIHMLHGAKLDTFPVQFRGIIKDGGKIWRTSRRWIFVSSVVGIIKVRTSWVA